MSFSHKLFGRPKKLVLQLALQLLSRNEPSSQTSSAHNTVSSLSTACFWFVTFGTYNRKPVLCCDEVHQVFLDFANKHKERGIAIGQYVIMPDHIHLFMRLSESHKLGATVGFIKKAITKALYDRSVEKPHWQPGFFDHLIRSTESYAEKWNYVQSNPQRAGLISNGSDWPYRGQITEIHY